MRATIGLLALLAMGGCQGTVGGASDVLDKLPAQALADFAQNCSLDLNAIGPAASLSVKCTPHTPAIVK